MTMKKTLLLFALPVIVLALIFIIIFTRGEAVKYDNDNSISSLITIKYSDYDIEKLREDIGHDNLNYA